MITLSNRTLSDVPDPVGAPSYDRSQLTAGIVHFGVGGFHRAHQAMYLDRLMNDGKALDWAICGVGVLPQDARMAEVMAEQNGLYTLMVKSPDGTVEARVIGSIVDYLHAPADPEAVLARMASPEIRIVSLTVTEGGYNIDADTGEFVADNPDVVHDVEAARNRDGGESPRTSFGLITEALRRRRDAGVPPFTVMSCDNIEGNGHVAQQVITDFAKLADAELAQWITDHVAFPNCMVDRITPQTTDDDRALAADRFGITDQWPVVCEDFTQWVLEDNFTDGRPPYEDAGVQLVDDVRPYELMKLRLLNASHQALCYFGYLAGYRLVHDVCQDELFATFLRQYMDREGTPTLEPVPGIDLDAYKTELIARFSNANVRDTVARLCAESSDRIPKWLLPVVRKNLDNDGEILRSVAVVASWARYAEGTDEDGEQIKVVDRLADELGQRARADRDNGTTTFIENASLFGKLADNEKFTDVYVRTLASLREKGSRATVTNIVENDDV